MNVHGAKHKFNSIDAAFLAAIAVAAAVLIAGFAGRNNTGGGTSDIFYYTIEVKNIRETAAAGLEKSVGLPFELYDKVTSDMGELVDIRTTPAARAFEQPDGGVVMSGVPERLDAALTFKVAGRVDENGYYTRDGKEIGAGTVYNVKSKWAAVVGMATSVWQ